MVRITARRAARRALERAWAARGAGGLPDIAEVKAALHRLPADDACVPLLKLELGLAHGYPAISDPAQGDRRQAREYLGEAVQELGPEDPQCGLPLIILGYLLLQDDHDISAVDR